MWLGHSLPHPLGEWWQRRRKGWWKSNGGFNKGPSLRETVWTEAQVASTGMPQLPLCSSNNPRTRKTNGNRVCVHRRPRLYSKWVSTLHPRVEKPCYSSCPLHLERVFLSTVASTLPTNYPEGLLPMCPRLSIWPLQGTTPNTHTHNLQFSKIQTPRAEMVTVWWQMGENLHPPFSSPMGLNETAQDFPNGQGKSEWTKYSKLSRVRLLATPWTVAYQAPPSMGFSRQEYWSGVPSPSPGI